MASQSYSLSINGSACEVVIEALEPQKQDPKQTAPGLLTAPAAAPTYAAAFPAPAWVTTQAAWVTARRVAHLPFH